MSHQSNNLADCLAIKIGTGLLYNFSSGLASSPLQLAANEYFLTKEEMIAAFWEFTDRKKTPAAALYLDYEMQNGKLTWEFFGTRHEVIEYLKESGTSFMIYDTLINQHLTNEEKLELTMQRLKSIISSINHSDVPCMGAHGMEAVGEAMEFVHRKIGEIEDDLNEYAEEADHP